MKSILKQVVGIDVAKKELVVSLGRLDEDLTVEIFAHKSFSNGPAGFHFLKNWVQKSFEQEINTLYVMEATGVYHEPLAYWLTDNKLQVSIVLPNKISNFFRTLDVNTITDKTASEAITRFGLERKLTIWQQPKKIYRELKQLSRERSQLIVERTALKNQLHAENAEAFPHPQSITRLTQRIQLIDQQEVQIGTEIACAIKKDQELSQKIKALTSIPGIGKLTAGIVIAETNGFELIRSKKQLVSYCGLDVKTKDSGISVKGKPKISKKGNRHIRKAMHLPALAAIKNNERYKGIFIRLVSKHGIKMKAVVAVQRKLLEMIYIIWKSNAIYDKEYQSGKNIQVYGSVSSS